MPNDISSLVKAAKAAGMKVPPNALNFNVNEYLHFDVFLTMQLNKPEVHPNSCIENAKIIARIPIDRITTIKAEKIWSMGWVE